MFTLSQREARGLSGLDRRVGFWSALSPKPISIALAGAVSGGLFVSPRPRPCRSRLHGFFSVRPISG